jgi:hypothetical protein
MFNFSEVQKVTALTPQEIAAALGDLKASTGKSTPELFEEFSHIALATGKPTSQVFGEALQITLNPVYKWQRRR